MKYPSRALWLAIAFVCYVCFAAIQASDGAGAPIVLLLVLPLVLAQTWKRSEAPRHPGEDRVDPSARRALRIAVWGGAVWLAARTGPVGRAGFDALANVGSGAACVAGLVALARIPSMGGMLGPPPGTRSLDAAGFAAFLWSIAVSLPLLRAVLPARRLNLDPLAIDYATTAASLGGLLLLVAATWRVRALRRLEIGVADRARGAFALAFTALLIAVPAAAFDVAPPDRVLPVALTVGAVLCTWTATTPEPTTVSGALRGILAIMMLGAPTVLASGLLARATPNHAGAVVLVSSSLAIVIGLVARAVARPLGPEQSRLLEAVDAASRGALEPEPDAAVQAALVALSRASGAANAHPELWRRHPEEVLSVDVAGYLHVEKGTAPASLYELALGEPERTLRAEVLDALQVRRPEVRPLLSWFEMRRAFSATLILDEDGPLGFLLLPKGNRNTPMTLEEARAVRVLTDRISALFAVSSALARSRERELAAIARAEALDDERERLEHIIALEGTRFRGQVERHAEPVRAASYSPAARACIEQLERLGRMNASFSMIVPPGVRSKPWAALAHLASTRRDGPFVHVDGASGSEHDPGKWQSDVSPLALADGGTLVIDDVQGLPTAVQEHIARVLSRHVQVAQRSAVCPPALIACVRGPLTLLVDDGRISPQLSRYVADATVELPPLHQRTEDLRAMVLDRLARLGQQRGTPLGIEPAALRTIVEHTWPANELELDAVLTRSAELATGSRVSLEDLSAAGLSEPLVMPNIDSEVEPVRRQRARRQARRD